MLLKHYQEERLNLTKKFFSCENEWKQVLFFDFKILNFTICKVLLECNLREII